MIIYYRFLIISLTININSGDDKINESHQMANSNKYHHAVKHEQSLSYVKYNHTNDFYTIEIERLKNSTYIHHNKNVVRFISLQNRSRGAEKIVPVLEL